VTAAEDLTTGKATRRPGHAAVAEIEAVGDVYGATLMEVAV
jgi:hypothetical protein